jgi:hypothetical protein
MLRVLEVSAVSGTPRLRLAILSRAFAGGDQRPDSISSSCAIGKPLLSTLNHMHYRVSCAIACVSVIRRPRS